MGIRTGANAPLGCPDFAVAHDDDKGFSLGTTVRGFDDVSGYTHNYIWCETGADHIVGEDVDIDATFTTADAAADTGAADAIVASTSGQFAWFQLKPAQPLA